MRNKDAFENARSVLFVPGTRPERFNKARRAGADLAIFDLEDSVLRGEKTRALENVMHYQDDGRAEFLSPFIVRVNSDLKDEEVAAILNSPLSQNEDFLGFMLPKVESTDGLIDISSDFVQVAIVESVKGIRNIYEIAESPLVSKIAFGGMDFAAEVESSSQAVAEFARVQIVIASAGAQKSKPWDSPSAEISNLDIVSREAKNARDIGFGGKLAIHPSQVSLINGAFEVDDKEIEWARRVLATSSGASQIDGQMVDRPVQLRAERILKRAKLTD